MKPRPRLRIPTADGIPLVGLTGGIGAGKSTALAAIEGLGCAVLSADTVVHQIQGEPETLEAISARFGPQVVRSGTLDRNALAAAAFADDEARRWLEEFTWPRVAERIAAWIAGLGNLDPRPRAGVVEVPLLFESGMDSAFDSTICILADEELRAQRARARGHAMLDERSARQLAPAEKAAKADWIVHNDGTEEDLRLALSGVVDSVAV